MYSQQPIYYEEPEFEFDPIKAFTTIKKFLSKLSYDNWENPHRYIIEEYFPDGQPNYISNKYELINITLNIENDGIAYFNDAEGILLEEIDNNSSTRLQSIIMDKVIDASINDYYKWITMTTENGYIRIYY